MLADILRPTLKWANVFVPVTTLHKHSQTCCILALKALGSSTGCIGAAPVGCSGSAGATPALCAAAGSPASTPPSSRTSSATSSAASSSVGDIRELGRRHCALRSVRSAVMHKNAPPS